MTFNLGQKLYRLVDQMQPQWTWDLNGEMRMYGRAVCLHWEIYVVQKVTPKGAWIQLSDRTGNGMCNFGRTWVSEHTSFVYPTRAAAKQAAISKRSYHVKMCRVRLAEAERRQELLTAEKVGEE